jgi:hypothetical protein
MIDVRFERRPKDQPFTIIVFDHHPHCARDGDFVLKQFLYLPDTAHMKTFGNPSGLPTALRG